jgi:plastocyanin
VIAARRRSSHRPGAAIVAVLAAVMVAIAGCGSGASASVAPVATTSVDLPKSYRFAPPVITVAAGATVTWTNHDDFSHNVTFIDEPAVPPIALPPGATGQRTFEAPGRHPYHCTFHPNDMKGEVIVTG